MAKVVMPLLSAESHGTVAKSVTYRTRVDMVTAGRYKKQRDAESLAQLAQRAKFESAVAAWPEICELAKSVLADLAALSHLNAWNWFVRLMLRGETPTGMVGDCYVGDFRGIG